MLLALRFAVGLFLLFAGLWVLAPRDAVDLKISFDPNAVGEDIESYLQNRESHFSNITPGTAKRIVWAGERGVKTPLSVIYLHGFSATSEEIRPVPDKVAQALGANLFYTRLAGHGRGAAAMAEPRAGDWIEDLAEALEVGRRIGDEVVVISTSTGGTLAALAATDPALSQKVKGMVFVSPNFGLNSPAAFILSLPLARHWGPLVAGRERAFAPANADHERFWTTRYPTAAVFPMAALVDHVVGLDFSRARPPALMLLSDDDQVVRPDISRDIAAQWGGGARVKSYRMGQGDDAYAHVIAGDILSPGQTAGVVRDILEWIASM